MARIKGLPELKSKMQKLKTGLQETVVGTIWDVVGLMVADAKADAPVDLAKLINSIDRKRSETGWSVVFYVGEAHGAFQEFGFGKYLEVPAELSEEALKFKGYKSGNFEEFLADITAWCERKGIDTGAAWLIAVSILRKGLRPKPYFYPAYLKHKDTIAPIMYKRIKELMK